MRFKSALLLLALTVLPVANLSALQSAQPTPAVASALASLNPVEQRIVEESRTGDRSQHFIEHLTSAHPRRLTGSTGIEVAEQWALETFRSFGLEAELEAWGDVPVGFDRGASRGRLVAPVERELTFITPSWTPGTDGPQRAKAVLEPESLEAAEALGDVFKGAWVVRDARVKGAQRRKLLAHYKAQGALGVLRAGSKSGLLVTGGSWRVDYDALPTLIEVRVLHDQHMQLIDSLEAGEELELEFDISAEFLPGPIEQYNVVAELKGSEFPDEYVIVQGHIDGWDGAQGACDNGTGVATTLEVARILSSLEVAPRRSVRFVLYSGEEQGLFGSRGYVKTHAEELERTSIVFNHDNGTNYLRGIAPTQAMLADFEHVFAPIQELDAERPFKIQVTPGLTPGPSDHAPFVEAGVPAFHWDQSPKGYRHLHHTQYDTIDQVNPADQHHSSLVIALAAWRFADLDHLVDRTRMRLPAPRRMGVYLSQSDGRLVQSVVSGSLAEEAGWKDGDVILAIDGIVVSSRGEIAAELQKGGPSKGVLIKRGEEELETVLDYSKDPMEEVRQERREAEGK